MRMYFHSKICYCIVIHKSCHSLGTNLEEFDLEMFGGGSDPYIIVTTEPQSLLMTDTTPGVTSHKHHKHDLANRYGVRYILVCSM